MFDTSPPAPAELADADDAALVAAIAGWARTAAVAEAHKLAAIAEWQRRCCDDPAREKWACDAWDAAAAEVACALNVSQGRASGQMDLAIALRDRLPLLGRRFLAGQVPLTTVSTIVWRTALVVDGKALAKVDAAVTRSLAEWGPLSQAKLEQAIDGWIEKYDPDAVRRVRDRMRGRSFTVGHRDDQTGTTAVFGRLSVIDAAVLNERLAVMVRSVCEDDPRTMAQRRADAVGAIAAGSFVLACRCDNPHCPAAMVDDGRASSVVVHVVADHASLDAQADPATNGAEPERETGAESEPERETVAEPEPERETVVGPESEPQRETVAEPEPERETGAEPESEPERETGAEPEPERRTAALIPGLRNGVVPAPLLAELIAHGATVRFVGSPDNIKATDSYRPSPALARFVRSRDLTCRVPGCDRPAVHADIDHTTPWPAGATHPSNLKCYCRKHHLIKTFWEGWSDSQSPDGTVHITTPTGHTYITKPFSSLLFPSWNTTTPPPPPTEEPSPTRGPGRGTMMPTRRRTRAQARASRIARERQLNAVQRELDRAAADERKAQRGAREQQSPRRRYRDYFDESLSHRPDYGDDPPPF
ncbi:protein of unknown function DUF222 [Mycolicibacterium chubuense NBB4]|uniref:HNH nuclease domain-containing protein n=1 Tax=Mycolicibacterium chubuense (strain NBB4) TaxID=710421 RepID=I4BDC8_MYCCN|nr:protein of unknown function DUF222 [Mycolicibacterium chubuense NBB4]